jgi:hypothetical protein
MKNHLIEIIYDIEKLKDTQMKKIYHFILTTSIFFIILYLDSLMPLAGLHYCVGLSNL